DHDGEGLLAEGVPGLLAVAHGRHLVPHVRQHADQQPAREAVVFGDEDAHSGLRRNGPFSVARNASLKTRRRRLATPDRQLSAPKAVSSRLRKPRRRSALATTHRLLAAIAAAAKGGSTRPAAASGSAIRL